MSTGVAYPDRRRRPTRDVVHPRAGQRATSARAVHLLDTTAGRRVALGVLLAAAGLLYSVGLGGYSGRDPYPTVDEFRSAVAASRVHYLVLAPGTTAPGFLADRPADWAIGAFPSTRVGEWLVADLGQPVKPAASLGP